MRTRDNEDGSMTLIEHLGELRARLLMGGGGLIAMSLVAAIFSGDIFEYAVRPLVAAYAEKNRVDTVLVASDSAADLAVRLEADPTLRFRGLVGSLAEAALEVESGGRRVDLVLVDGSSLPEDGSLLADLLVQEAPEVTYLVDRGDPRIEELQLEGAAVSLRPPRPVALRRIIRRAAAAAGKTVRPKLQTLTPMEPFFAYLKIALVVGLFLSCPIWLFQLWRFVAPGLYREERRFVLPVVVSASCLFVLGGLFAYYLVFPVMFDVLVGSFLSESMRSDITVSSYLSMLMMLTVAFGVVFELPLAMGLASALGLVTGAQLRALRKYAWVAATILGAVLTPADPISQLLMAVPLIAFYEVGTFIATVFDRGRLANTRALDVRRDA